MCVHVCVCVLHFKIKIQMEISSIEHYVFFKVRKKNKMIISEMQKKARNSMANETNEIYKIILVIFL